MEENQNQSKNKPTCSLETLLFSAGGSLLIGAAAGMITSLLMTQPPETPQIIYGIIPGFAAGGGCLLSTAYHYYLDSKMR